MLCEKNKMVVFCFGLWLISFGDAFSLGLVGHLVGREADQDVDNKITLESNGSSVLRLELNTEKQLAVQLLVNLSPIASANIDWRILQSVGGSRQKAYFIVDDSQSSTLETRSTDERGFSVITLNPGEIASAFDVIASASVNLDTGEPITVRQVFQVNAGIQASIQTDTPEVEVALTLDRMCPKLAANESQLSSQERALLERCNAFQQSVSEGKTVEVKKALREISPEEVAVQADIGSGFGSQQMSNVASRLNAIRRGTTQISFSNLGMRYGGNGIPVSYMLNTLFANNEQSAIGSDVLLNNKWGVFANGNISIGNRSATAKEGGFSFDSYNLTTGADYRIRSNTFVGAALGISKSEVDISEQGGNSSAGGLSLNLYGNHYISQKWYVEGLLNIGYTQFNMARNINFELSGNVVNRVASSDTQGMQQAVSVGMGYEVSDGALSGTFFGKLNYSKLTIDSFVESGAQELDLRIDEQSIGTASSSIGAQMQFVHSARWGVLIPFIGFSWEHEFSGSPEVISGTFVNDQFNSAFRIETENVDMNYFNSVQGVTAIFPRGISAYLKVENVLGREFYNIMNVSFGGRIELTF